jgi:DNA ligase-associated metallophosphoesterase
MNPDSISDPASPVLILKGHELFPQACGALWWPAFRTLIISDLHFGKGTSFAVRGQNLPPYDTRTTLKLIQHLISRFTPARVISLGDSFHDPRAAERLDPADRNSIRFFTEQCEWIWIEGNHDPDPPEDVGGTAARQISLGRLVFRHEPTGASGEVSGHLHPCARLTGRGGKLVRRRCFVTDGNALILPSMGAFTGGLNILDQAYDEVLGPDRKVYMSGTERVFAVPTTRLAPDGRTGRARWQL